MQVWWSATWNNQLLQYINVFVIPLWFVFPNTNIIMIYSDLLGLYFDIPELKSNPFLSSLFHAQPNSLLKVSPIDILK